MTTLSTVLKAATAATHSQLDGLPYFLALQDGSLPKLSIVSFLRSLSIVHAVVERNLAGISNPKIVELYKLAGPKLPALCADLELLGVDGLPSIAPAIRHALQFGDDILRSSDNPCFLVGALYVLEGSQNGGALLAQSYARCVNRASGRLTYIGSYGSDTPAHWDSFIGCLDSLVVTDRESALIVNSAKSSFKWITNICASLYPFSERDLMHHVAEINFEAGDHAIPQNPLEVELALRVGRRAWEQYPYLQCRFGERGRRFTNSDSCWLVTLTHMPDETVTKNLTWLRTVLSARGVPTVILETHVREISQELRFEFGEHLDGHHRMDQFLSNLELERKKISGERDFSHLVEEFERQFSSCAGFRVKSAAQLITSAWIDERSGITGSLAATQDWFANSERFSREWITNVNGLVALLDRMAQTQC